MCAPSVIALRASKKSANRRTSVSTTKFPVQNNWAMIGGNITRKVCEDTGAEYFRGKLEFVEYMSGKAHKLSYCNAIVIIM